MFSVFLLTVLKNTIGKKKKNVLNGVPTRHDLLHRMSTSSRHTFSNEQVYSETKYTKKKKLNQHVLRFIRNVKMWNFF